MAWEPNTTLRRLFDSALTSLVVMPMISWLMRRFKTERVAEEMQSPNPSQFRFRRIGYELNLPTLPQMRIRVGDRHRRLQAVPGVGGILIDIQRDKILRRGR